MAVMRTVVVLILVVGLAGPVAPDSLGRALDQQRQDIMRQQAETRRLTELQTQALQQQQEQFLRLQLQVIPFERRPLLCQPAGATLVCR